MLTFIMEALKDGITILKENRKGQESRVLQQNNNLKHHVGEEGVLLLQGI